MKRHNLCNAVIADGVNCKAAYRHTSIIDDEYGFYNVQILDKRRTCTSTERSTSLWCNYLVNSLSSNAMYAFNHREMWNESTQYLYLTLPFTWGPEYWNINTYLANLKRTGKPLIIVYQLAEETEEVIELPNIPTFENTTIIEVGTDVQPDQFYYKYYSSEELV